MYRFIKFPMYRFIKFPILLLIIASTAVYIKAEEQVSQTIELYPGWNLISIQVADSDTGVLTIPQFLESIVATDEPIRLLSNSSYWDNYVQYHPVLEIWTYEGWLLSGESDFLTPSQMVKSFVDPVTSKTRRGGPVFLHPN